MGRTKKYRILLAEEDKKQLQSAIDNKKSSKSVIRRCSILLELDENSKSCLTQRQIANSYGVSKVTVSNVVHTYVTEGVSGIIKNKRNPNSNARRKADGRTEAEIIRIACGPAPKGRARWSLRLLEKQVALELEEPISRETIRRTLKKTNLSLTEMNTGASLQKKTQNS